MCALGYFFSVIIPIPLKPEFNNKGCKSYSADYEGRSDVRSRFNASFKPLITSCKSIPHLSNVEFGFKKFNYFACS